MSTWFEFLKNLNTADAFSASLSHGHLWAYGFVFLGGVLTSFTPCIFPMVPITITVIGAKSQANKKSKSFLLSLAYVLGIALTYAVLGVIAASTGKLFGSLLGNKWVITGICATFVLMALSMFGLFEIQPPAWIRNRFAGPSKSSGMMGAFLAGLASGVVASPCVGPVLIGILAFVAKTAEVFFGFTLLFTFALGMGLIFLVLGTFSAYLTRLPRAGAWMEKIKTVFGIVLLMTAVYYSRPLWVNQWNGNFSDSNHSTTSQTSPNMNWQNYSESLVDDAKSSGRPVIIDFWATWCEACHELDKKTYSDSAVISATKDHVLLKLDATEVTGEVEAVFKKYKVLGLPTVLFIDSKGEVLTSRTLTGFEGPEAFLKRVK